MNAPDRRHPARPSPRGLLLAFVTVDLTVPTGDLVATAGIAGPNIGQLIVLRPEG